MIRICINTKRFKQNLLALRDSRSFRAITPPSPLTRDELVVSIVFDAHTGLNNIITVFFNRTLLTVALAWFLIIL